MSDYDAGYFLAILLILAVAIWMMVTGFSKENLEKVDKANKDHLADSVAEGIRRHEQERPAPPKCDNCGKGNPASAKYCSACGAALTETKP